MYYHTGSASKYQNIYKTQIHKYSDHRTYKIDSVNVYLQQTSLKSSTNLLSAFCKTISPISKTAYFNWQNDFLAKKMKDKINEDFNESKEGSEEEELRNLYAQFIEENKEVLQDLNKIN